MKLIINITKLIKGKEPMLIWTLGIMLSFSFIFYAYLVNQTVLNVLARGKFEKTAPLLRTEVGNLESTYLSLKNKITLEFAYSEGFRDVAVSKFISRKTLGQILTLNNEI